MTFREKALLVALGEIGVTEHPHGSNWGPRVKQYLASAGLTRPAPWCMSFVNWAYRQAGLDIKHPNEGSVGFFEAWARSQGDLVSSPKRGDVACYRFDADNWPDHVGIVEKVNGNRIVAVEGNTSLANDANGGTVMRRDRNISLCRFVRIPGDVKQEEEEMTPEIIKALEAAVERYEATRQADPLPESQRIVFWALVRAREAGSPAVVAALKAKIAKAKAALS